MNNHIVRRVVIALVVPVAALLAGGVAPSDLQRLDKSAASDSAAVAATIERYHSALAAGDSVAALALLAPDAMILESGGAETRDQYRSHHLPADIEFARAVPAVRGSILVRVQGDVAWATSTATYEGQFRGRAINSVSAELMVLSRNESAWLIRAIHWSSRTRRQ